MKMFMAAAALAATMLAGTAISSQAATSNPVVDASNGNFGGTSPTGNKTGNPFDYFSFTIPLLGGYTINGSVTTSPFGPVSILAFDFFSDVGTSSAPGTVIGSPGFSGGGVFPTKTFYLNPITLAAGTYYVGVQASGGKNNTNSGYTGNLSVSAVPLPTSVALFGAAVAGLGVVGAMRRKSTRAAANV